MGRLLLHKYLNTSQLDTMSVNAINTSTNMHVWQNTSFPSSVYSQYMCNIQTVLPHS